MKVKKSKVYSPFKINIFGAVLSNMQIIKETMKVLYFYYALLIFLDIYKYAWTTHLREKKVLKLLMQSEKM